jgi:large subunit ribosomal protein L4
VLDRLELAEGKTRLFAGIMKGLGIGGGALFVVDRMEGNMVRASRNIPDVEVVTAHEVTVYQVLRYPTVVVTKAGLAAIEGRMKGVQAAGAVASATAEVAE